MDEEVIQQPALTLSHISFTRGELEGKPCVVVYDEATDKTSVIAFNSKDYDKAIIAMTILEVAASPVPKSALNKKTIIHKVQTPKLILPGSNASN